MFSKISMRKFTSDFAVNEINILQKIIQLQ